MRRPFPTWWLAGTLIGPAVLSGRAETAGAVPTMPDTSLTFSLIRTFGALVLVLALFFAGVWLFKNWQRLAARGGRLNRLQVLEVKSLGARHALYVVGYEHQRLLLAASPTGVTMIAHLPEAGEVRDAEPRPSATFAETLRATLGSQP